jgi:hypothetical protein
LPVAQAKLRQVAKFFPPKRAEFLEQAASVAESAEKLLAAMRAHADACNRRQILAALYEQGLCAC